MGISTVTSESLQLKLRQLLPSQQGFGSDLSASDTIIPVIDLTQAAEGSDVRADLQSCISFGGITAFATVNTTDVLANTTGFYRIVGDVKILQNVTGLLTFTMTDTATTKQIRAYQGYTTGGILAAVVIPIDFIVFLGTDESISCISSDIYTRFDGVVRQIADNQGVLVNPVGFNPQ